MININKWNFPRNNHNPIHVSFRSFKILVFAFSNCRGRAISGRIYPLLLSAGDLTANRFLCFMGWDFIRLPMSQCWEMRENGNISAFLQSDLTGRGFNIQNQCDMVWSIQSWLPDIKTFFYQIANAIHTYSAPMIWLKNLLHSVLKRYRNIHMNIYIYMNIWIYAYIPFFRNNIPRRETKYQYWNDTSLLNESLFFISFCRSYSYCRLCDQCTTYVIRTT